MLEKFVGERIREAMARGEFDNLPGQGRPVDLTEYFQLPEDLRVAYTLLRQHNIVPEEVRLLRDLGELRARREACADPDQRAELARAINHKQMALNVLLERRNK